MARTHRRIAVLSLVPWAASLCHSFSFDASSVARSLLPRGGTLVRQRRQPWHSCTSASSGAFSLPTTNRNAALTMRWNSPAEPSATETTPENDANDDVPSPPSLDLHPPTIQAIAQALLLRAQNTPDLPLRFVDDGKTEEWEVTLAAGKVAQRAAEEWASKQGLDYRNPKHEEVMQIMAGRVVAILTRFEELEEELLNRCYEVDSSDESLDRGLLFGLGVPEEELGAWQTTNVDDPDKRVADAAAAIDAACLFDENLRANRARSLLAMFLHEIEGPGLRRNNVVIPCMDVDFLPEDEWAVLLDSKDEEEEQISGASEESVAIDSSIEEEEVDRPSLHPITIDAIEEAFRLRAQNSTTSPLRLLDQRSEWFDVQYSIIKFADRFMEKFTKPSSRSTEEDAVQLTEEELQAIGGRIVGVVMRLDDLEWEWNHRITTSSLAEADSPSMIPYDMWKTTLGLHPDDVEQKCFLTVDNALSEERDFARARAERMLALFLMNIESPGMETSGNTVPGGSHPDFIEDELQLELMMPRPKKKRTAGSV